MAELLERSPSFPRAGCGGEKVLQGPSCFCTSHWVCRGSRALPSFYAGYCSGLYLQRAALKGEVMSSSGTKKQACLLLVIKLVGSWKCFFSIKRCTTCGGTQLGPSCGLHGTRGPTYARWCHDACCAVSNSCLRSLVQEVCVLQASMKRCQLIKRKIKLHLWCF